VKSAALLVIFVASGALGCGALSSVLPARDPITDFKSRLAGGAVQDGTISTGLVTDTESVALEPPGYRVSWIKWDSGFRGSGLQIGDLIIAIDGERVVRPATTDEAQRTLFKAIGQYGESQRWQERGTADGTTITLTVRRRAPGQGTQVVDVRGVVAAERTFTKENGHALFGPGGPDTMAGDDFGEAWSAWYEKLVRRCQRVLDGGWQSTLDTRATLAEHLEDRARVDYAVEHYPGPFAEGLRADFEAVRSSLAGRRYELDAKALAYRQLGEERAAQIAAAGTRAREAFLQTVTAKTIAPFPAVDPIRGDRAKVVGKVVVLPTIANRDWVSEAGHGYMAWRGEGGWYFLDSWSPAAGRLLEAVERYRRAVAPNIDDRYAIIGRIGATPKMLVVDGSAATGLVVEPIGASVGDQMFVDLTKSGSAAPFAGEETLVKLPDARLGKDASPAQVMAAFVAAIKNDDEQTWKQLFATWRAVKWRDDGSVIWYPYYESNLGDAWIDSRRLILDRVYDARVIYVSDVVRIMTGNQLPHGPVVEQVTVELDHVGRFDNEYRAFDGVAVHRVRTLQRVDGGPWRIASTEGL
jgi:hypothetical protein